MNKITKKTRTERPLQSTFLMVMMFCIGGIFLINSVSATWVDSLNTGLVGYWSLNESAGNVADSVGTNDGRVSVANAVQGVGGILNNSIDFTPDGYVNISTTSTDYDMSSFSVSLWAYVDDLTTEGYPISHQGIGQGDASRPFSIQVVAGLFRLGITKPVEGEKWINFGNVTQLNKWYHVVFSYNATNGNITLYTNGTLDIRDTYTSGGTLTNYDENTWVIGARGFAYDKGFNGKIDEVGIWNKVLTPTEVSNLFGDFTPPAYNPPSTINLNNPEDNYVTITSKDINFNCSTTTDGDSLLNITLQIDGVNNYTVYNTTNAQNNIFLEHPLSFGTEGSYNWSCVLGTTSEVVTSDTRNFNVTSFTVNSQVYTSPAYSSSSNLFLINISYDSSYYLSSTGYLIYNGTSYLATQVGSNGEYIFNINKTAPTVSTSINIPFYWNLILNNGTGNYIYNSTLTNQTVSPLGSMQVVNGTCPSGLTKVMNFTFYDESNSTTLLDVSVSYNFQYGISNNTGFASYGNTTATELVVCLNTSQSPTYEIGYGEIDYVKTGYTARRYYIFEGTRVSNVTIHNPLYSLPNGDSTSFLIEIREPTLTPYVNKYISLLRWYPSLNEYKVVEMGKTDDKGQTVAKVKVEDVDYRVGVYELDGTLIHLASPIRMVCLASPCSYTLTVQDVDSYAFDDIQNIQAVITYSGGIFTLVYNDPSQNTQLMELKVKRIGGVASDTLLCETNGTSFTGVLICDVSAYSGILKATAYRSASPSYSVASLIIDTATSIFQGTFGLFLQFLITGVLVFLGLFSPIVAIILGITSLLLGVLLFKTVIYPIMVGFAIVGIIAIHFMRRSSN